MRRAATSRWSRIRARPLLALEITFALVAPMTLAAAIGFANTARSPLDTSLLREVVTGLDAEAGDRMRTEHADRFAPRFHHDFVDPPLFTCAEVEEGGTSTRALDGRTLYLSSGTRLVFGASVESHYGGRWARVLDGPAAGAYVQGWALRSHWDSAARRSVNEPCSDTYARWARLGEVATRLPVEVPTI